MYGPLLAAFVDYRSMADFDDHNNELVLADFIDNSVDSLSHSVPFLGGKLYGSFAARIFAQGLNSFQDARNILFRDAP